MSTIMAGGFSVQFVGPGEAKVDLILAPSAAVEGLTTIVRGYKQIYSDVPPEREEQIKLLGDINRTKLHTPLEMLSYTWLVRDVTRAFTHQLVRTRVGAAYVQESMRFSDKRHAKVLVPPAIAADPGRLSAYQETCGDAFQLYAQMIEGGVPVQDARGVLPHNVLTHAFVSYTLSTLAKTASLRYCCQAQAMTGDGEGEWKQVLGLMRATLPPDLQTFVCAPWEAGEVSCGFEASFDRPCRWPEKFTANFEALKEKRAKAQKDAANRPLPGQLALPLDTVAPTEEPVQVPVQATGEARALLEDVAKFNMTYGLSPEKLEEALDKPAFGEVRPLVPESHYLAEAQAAFGDLRSGEETAATVRMGLDLNKPMGHGGPAQPLFPETAPEFIKIYQGENIRMFNWGNVLHVEMGYDQLWDHHSSIRLYDDKVEKAEGAGARIIHTHVLDTGNVYIMTIPDFRASGRPSQLGPGGGMAHHVPLFAWRHRTVREYMEGMRDGR